MRSTATTSAGPCNRDSLFDIEDPASYQATGNQDSLFDIEDPASYQATGNCIRTSCSKPRVRCVSTSSDAGTEILSTSRPDPTRSREIYLSICWESILEDILSDHSDETSEDSLDQSSTNQDDDEEDYNANIEENANPKPMNGAGSTGEDLEHKAIFTAWPPTGGGGVADPVCYHKTSLAMVSNPQTAAKVRKVVIKDLPRDSTVNFVASLVYGGPIEEIQTILNVGVGKARRTILFGSQQNSALSCQANLTRGS